MTEDVATTGRRRIGRPPTSDDERAAQRLAVSRHAVELFRRHGLAATTGLQIARAAGISERTLWRLFRVKESCAEPLFGVTIATLSEALRSWPADRHLLDHLESVYAPPSGDGWADTEAVLALVRMSRQEPALRAVLLMVGERAEPALAAALAVRSDTHADAPIIRTRAAMLNAALRVATDDFAHGAADGVTAAVVARFRSRFAEAVEQVTASAGSTRSPHPS